jgi:hypothetical protein
VCVTDHSCIRQSENVDGVLDTLPRARAALLRTCRQVYQDAATLLYSTNIFDVDDLNTFIDWSRTILPGRLAAVRALGVSWDIFWPPLTTFDLSRPYRVGPMAVHQCLALRNSDQVWLDFWDIVATKMPGLQDLRVRIGTMHPFYAGLAHGSLFGRERGLRRDVHAEWVRPLLNIRGLKRLELDLLEDRRSVSYPVGASGGHDDLDYRERTNLFVEEVRRVVCAPSPSQGRWE